MSSPAYVDLDVESFNVVESNVEYYTSEGLSLMPVDRAFDVYVNGSYLTSLVMSPSWVVEATIGFLVGEGLVEAGGVRSVVVSLESRVVNVEADGFKFRRRFFVDDCVALASQASPVKSRLKVSYSLLERLYGDFESRSSKNVGVQASGIYDLGSKRAVIAYDVSRYTSVAKALGYALREAFNLGESIMITTGRASGDIIVMAANTGIPVVVTTRNPLYSGYIAAITYKVTLTIASRRGGELRLRTLTYNERIIDTR